MKNIKHIVYLMLENRSLDNVLGWLYQQVNPVHVIPGNSNPVFNGLQTGKYYNPDKNGVKHYVQKITEMDYQVPTIDPNEGYQNVNNQLFGSMSNPPSKKIPPMLGFYNDYATVNSDTGQIMKCYGSTVLNIINQIAANFALSDAYYSSVPTQTNCNRAFAATGNSIGMLKSKTTGMVDNHWGDGIYLWDPVEFTGKTIWNVLNENNYNTPSDWTVFYNQTWPLNKGDYCFTQDLFYPSLKNDNDHFVDIRNFFSMASAGTLPAFSFLEPAWYLEEWGIGQNGNDYHPPGNLQPGESFLTALYISLRKSPNWNNTLLIINFDEHGGTYDHQPPPWGAITPWADPKDGTPAPQTTEYGFGFDRFGVRVPLILVSPYIKNSTVFRAPEPKYYDHTSVIATILKHFNIPASTWGLGSRVANAPTFENVLTLDKPRTDTPEFDMKEIPKQDPEQIAPNDLQWMIVRRMLARTLQQSGYPKDKFSDLYEQYFKNIHTMKEMNTAIENILEVIKKG